jgi:hypothetical protein
MQSQLHTADIKMSMQRTSFAKFHPQIAVCICSQLPAHGMGAWLSRALQFGGVLHVMDGAAVHAEQCMCAAATAIHITLKDFKTFMHLALVHEDTHHSHVM